MEKGRPCREYSPLEQHDTRFSRLETQGVSLFLFGIAHEEKLRSIQRFEFFGKLFAG